MMIETFRCILRKGKQKPKKTWVSALEPGLRKFLPPMCLPSSLQVGYNKLYGKNGKKAYNSKYSLVVTQPTTNLPTYSLNMGERTGSLVLCSLWSYVTETAVFEIIYRQLVHDVAKTPGWKRGNTSIYDMISCKYTRVSNRTEHNGAGTRIAHIL